MSQAFRGTVQTASAMAWDIRNRVGSGLGMGGLGPGRRLGYPLPVGAWVGGGAWLLLQVWAQTSTGTVAANELPTAAPERFRVELGLRELVNPGAEGGGVLWVHALSAGLSFVLIPEWLGVEVTAPMAVAINLDPENGSSQLLLGNPSALFVGHLQGGRIRSRLGLGVSLPWVHLGLSDTQLLKGVATLNGGANAYHWSTSLLALAIAEVALELESGWLSVRGTTAIPFEEIKPSGDVQLEGAFRFSEAISVGTRVGLARYQVPLSIADRIVRICIADDPMSCPAGPPPPRFELESAGVAGRALRGPRRRSPTPVFVDLFGGQRRPGRAALRAPRVHRLGRHHLLNAPASRLSQPAGIGSKDRSPRPDPPPYDEGLPELRP
jgi:hypothetical protein